MGKATGKADKHAGREPSVQALVPTPQLVAIRSFAKAHMISEAEALRALIGYGLEHADEVAWRMGLPNNDEQQPQIQLSLPAPCTAERGKFSPPKELVNATRHYIQPQ